MKGTKEILQRLVNQFDSKGWPKITIGFKTGGGPIWVTGAVDDETRDIIVHAKKILNNLPTESNLRDIRE